jgi:hypothetical protein
LVAVVEEDEGQVVQFSHSSVNEFLTSPRLADSSADVSRFHIPLGPAHVILASACLGALLQLDDHVDQYNVKDRFPLGLYAAEHWVEHAQFEDVSSRLQEGMKILFDPDGPYLSAWIRVHDIDVKPTPFFLISLYFYTWSYSYKSTLAPLYYAALCGFHNLAEHLVDNCSQKVNVRGGHCVSPLPAALARGHFKTAQSLYERGGDICIPGYGRRTLLHTSTITYQVDVVQWLLSHGADPNLGENLGWTPLLLAASNGWLEIAQILLQHNADTNLPDDGYRTPLHLASESGHPNVAQLLLEHGVDVNARDKSGSTPLHLASRVGPWHSFMEGKLEVVRLLIEHGAEVGMKDNEGKTPLQVAFGSDMAKLLSDHGSK